MASTVLDTYRRQWPRIGALAGLALAGTTSLISKRLSKPQLYSTLNLGSLFVHQYEEYVDPGYFPGQFNHGVLKSDQPRNYPLNRNNSLCVNTVFAYPYYIAPILFPQVKWLGMSPVMFGWLQSVLHGAVFPLRAGDKYSPGFLASFFLHLPVGIQYFRALHEEQGITRADVVKASAYTVAFAAVAVAGPVRLGGNLDSPHAFSQKQMGHHDV